MEGVDMEYITGIHALNLPSSLLTCGDWHQSAIQWENPKTRKSEDSVFGDYGIEREVTIPEHTGKFNAANHIRALLDLLELGNYSEAQGINRDFIGNDDYNEEVFDKVIMMRDLPHWHKIDSFMGSEYYSKWVNYKRRCGL
jgi:hypothetical protein